MMGFVRFPWALVGTFRFSGAPAHGWTSSDYTTTAPAEAASPAPAEPVAHFVETHSLLVGYILWVFGFTGSHRFYYGRPITGTIWFLTGGLLLIGWLIDVFFIPAMERRANLRYWPGPYDYTVAWILLTFLGIFGIHRFYLGKWITGIVYLLTGGLFLVGILYDFWTLNEQVHEKNIVL